MSIYNDIVSGKKKIGVIGLGYVGLPIALAFAKKVPVIGFDINPKRVEMMKNKQDPSQELPPEAFENSDIIFTSNPEDLKDAHFFIVTVPTPIDEHNIPNLTPVISASKTLKKYLKKGDYVVYESTVFPGCTEEICVPILEESGLKFKEDFKVGYSPERINPGDCNHTLENTPRIISGCDTESLDEIEKIYKLVINAHLHRAPEIRVAEAAKVIENTQRDLNIALMNELSMIFNKMGINTYDVIDAAGTKWNFQKFSPGLVGGHCIGVDPYYLVYKAQELGHHPEVILAGRRINDNMGFYIGQQVVKKLISLGKAVRGSRALVMGITFKEDVADIRNSKVVDLISELESFMVDVDVIDPRAVPEEVEEEYGIKLKDAPEGKYDAVIVAVKHKEYSDLSPEYIKSISNLPALFVDIKGIYRNKLSNLDELAYLSL